MLASTPLLAVLLVGAVFTESASAAQSVQLGTATPFAVLAATAVTDVPTSSITGNVGLSPAAGTNYAGLTQAEVTGTIYSTDGTGPAGNVNNPALLTTAKSDLTTAYVAAAGQSPTSTFNGADNQLGGQTLVAGVYAFGHAATANITAASPLVLNGEGNPDAVFVFQASSDLVTASNSVVQLENGAQACNVFWQVSSSATLNTASTFVGTIMALTSATLDSGATVQGRVLARNGAVTLDANTITAPTTCTVATSTPTTTPTATTTPTGAGGTGGSPARPARPAPGLSPLPGAWDPGKVPMEPAQQQGPRELSRSALRRPASGVPRIPEVVTCWAWVPWRYSGRQQSSPLPSGAGMTTQGARPAPRRNDMGGSIRYVRHPRRRWALGAVLLLAGVAAMGLGLRGSDHPLAGPTPSPLALKAAVAAPPVAAALATDRSVPVLLRIPAIGLTVFLGSSLGVNIDGTVQVPTGTAQPGWFRLGPTPGQIGSSVILGHVDSYRGPGVFFQLRTLATGDQVDVGLADGVTAQFTVDSVALYSKMSFPADRVYGSHGSSALQLVTCGGAFDQQTGSYLSNVVVYTSLSAVMPLVPSTALTEPSA